LSVVSGAVGESLTTVRQMLGPQGAMRTMEWVGVCQSPRMVVGGIVVAVVRRRRSRGCMGLLGCRE
jgi:hypothetical protein